MKASVCERFISRLWGARRRQRGYSMAELLITVGLIGVLGAVSVVGGARIMSDVRQNTLDEMARTLYAAAQTQLTERYSYGGMAALTPPATGVGVVEEAPYGYPGEYEDALCYIRNKPGGVQSAQNPAAAALFPAGALAGDMSGMNWVVEYDPATGGVFAVFYSESFAGDGYTEFYGTDDTDALRQSPAARNGRVGYYAGGLSRLPVRSIGDMSCMLELENGEELSAYMSCLVPADVAGAVTVSFEIEVQGLESGHTVTRTVTPAQSAGDERAYEYTLILDSLAGGETFYENFCRLDAASGVTDMTRLIPGENITVQLTVSAEADDSTVTLPRVSDRATTNSLFACDPEADRDPAAVGARQPSLYDGDAYIARIACGRHLQNLDAAISGLATATSGVYFPVERIKAVQLADIDFSAAGAWAAAYVGRSFTPVENEALDVYDGQGHVIRGLTVDHETGTLGAEETEEDKTARRENAGLFGVFPGSAIRELTMIDPRISGAANVGALAGTLSGDGVALSGCAVYADGLLSEPVSAWLSGSAAAGGLAGRVTADASVADSFAAVVLRGGGFGGGLVGRADGALTVSDSYADCAIGGGSVGGLAGTCGSGSRFESCYSAGFVLGAPDVAAGVTTGPAAVSRVYSLFNFDDLTASVFTTASLTYNDDGGVEKYPEVPASATAAVKIALVGTGGSGSGLYTCRDAEVRGVIGAVYMTVTDMVESINGLSWKSAESVHPYGLTAGLSDPRKDGRFPNFLDLPHYGDWLESAPDEALYARIYKNGTDYTLVFEYGGAEDSDAYGAAVEGAEWKGKDTFLRDVYSTAGSVPWSSFLDGGASVSRAGITAVAFHIGDGEAAVRPVSTSYWFYGFTGMTRIGDTDSDGAVTDSLTKLATDNASRMDFMFYNCKALTSIDVSHFDTAKVSNMRAMFDSCSGLTSLDLSGFRTENVTNMSSMFNSCSGLTSLNVSGFRTGGVQSMVEMFKNCSGLTSHALSGFDTGNCVAMQGMFSGCTRLTELDLGSFDTASVTSMQNMFKDCSSLTSLDISGFDTGNVTNMNSMFATCKKLTELDLSGFDTRSVTDMGGMFMNCLCLTSLDVSGFDTAAVTDMSRMFMLVSGVPVLDLSGFDTGNVTSMANMFNGCGELTSIFVSDGFDTTLAAAESGNMFSGCEKLVGGAGTTFDENCTDAGYARIDGGTEAPGYFTRVPPVAAAIFGEEDDFTLVFARLDALSAYGTPAAGPWNGDEGGFLTASYSATQLPPWIESAAAEGFALRGVVFDRAVAPTSTAFWFYGCTSLTALDISGLDTADTENMSHMFDGCTALTTITVSDSFVTDAVTASGGMFGGCTVLTGGAGTVYDADHTDAGYARVDGGTEAPGYFTTPSIPDEQEAGGLDGLASMRTDGAPVEYEKLTELKIVTEDRITGTLSAVGLPEIWFDGRSLYTAPDGSDDDLVGSLAELCGTPAREETYHLFFGATELTLYGQWRADEKEEEEVLWRYALTGTDGTLVLTADKDGRITYNTDAVIRYDSDLRRLFSDKEHTILLTNLTALLGAREDESGDESRWPDAGNTAEFRTDKGANVFTVRAYGDGLGGVDHYIAVRVDGTELFRADSKGEIEYLYEPPVEPTEDGGPAEPSEEPEESISPINEERALPPDETTETEEEPVDDPDGYDAWKEELFSEMLPAKDDGSGD